MSMIDQRPYISAAAKFASGADSPRAFLERCLAAIAAHEGEVKAFVHMNAQAARKAADAASARWSAGKPLSPIDGMPIGVKDVIETEDMPTEMGSPLFKGYRGGRDSASVKALRQAGAVILGKTVTTEFAASSPGPTRNPWDIRRTPGGSSSGSAAGSAAGFFSVGLGTQVLGSILRPASFCGVVGYKPSFGAINRGGTHDFMSQSAQGALGASRADVWRALREVSERCGGDAGYPGLLGPMELPADRKPKRLVFFETPGWAKCSEALKASTRGALDKLRKSGVEIVGRKDSAEVEYLEQAFAICVRLTREINGWESIWPMNIYRDRDASKISKPMLERLAEAEKMRPSDYHRALAERATLRGAYAKLADRADACVTLAAIGPAPLGLESTGDAAYAVHSSVLGVPALTLPLLKEEHLPVGVQLMGFDWRDADLFAVAGAVETMLET
jgi:Asp-tRNA(Asn)/Glu-tRNA(Gln) amidotransferase A subunit family amidase